MSATQKTWVQVEQEIAHTMDLFLGASYTIESVFAGAKAAVRRKAGSAGQTLEERTVTLRAVLPAREPTGRIGWRHQVILTVNREETALENLELLAKAVEWIRMAHVRRVDGLVVKLLRQMYPEPQAAPPPPPRQDRVGSTGPYATLHIANDAPLAVAEAAYRALSRQAHPDAGGTHERMRALNLAIEQIRLAKTAAGARTP